MVLVLVLVLIFGFGFDFWFWLGRCGFCFWVGVVFVWACRRLARTGCRRFLRCAVCCCAAFLVVAFLFLLQVDLVWFWLVRF